jgi:DnaJ-class molecular chaperone
MRSAYDILGVSGDASTDDIRRAYRSLVRTHHPDLRSDAPDAHEEFLEIKAAYEILVDPARRAEHDRNPEEIQSTLDEIRQLRLEQRLRRRRRLRRLYD